MEIDITQFKNLSMVDSCAIWNILSSKLLVAASFNAKCYFSITKFVEYECLVKVRKNVNKEDEEIKSILLKLLRDKKINSITLSIGDLQNVDLLESRKRLGIGELSSIALASKTRQAFITDDQRARKLAKAILGKENVQTTPQLLGWLFHRNYLSESDIHEIVKEHIYYRRPLERFFLEVHNEFLRISFLVRHSKEKSN